MSADVSERGSLSLFVNKRQWVKPKCRILDLNRKNKISLQWGWWSTGTWCPEKLWSPWGPSPGWIPWAGVQRSVVSRGTFQPQPFAVRFCLVGKTLSMRQHLLQAACPSPAWPKQDSSPASKAHLSFAPSTHPLRRQQRKVIFFLSDCLVRS